MTTTAVTTTRSVTVTATVDGGSATGTLTLTPATAPPVADTVTIKRAEWKSGVLRVEATSSNANAILGLYHDASGSADSFMFGLIASGGGRYAAQHQWLDNPLHITVRSNLGGSATAAT